MGTVLMPDAAAVTPPMNEVGEVVRQVDDYCKACLALGPANPKPGSPSLFSLGSVDPALGAALATAQSHAKQWTDGLRARAIDSVFGSLRAAHPDTDFAAFEEVVKDLRASNGRATPGQRDQVLASLTALGEMMRGLIARLEAAHDQLLAFTDALAADHQRLASGTLGIPAFIDELNNKREELKKGGEAWDTAVKYVAFLEFEVVEIVVLEAYGRALDQVIPINETVRRCLSDLMVAWVALPALVGSLIRRITDAGEQQLGSVLQDLDIGSSREEWREISRVAQRLGPRLS